MRAWRGKWWDVCGVIDVGADHLGTVTLWDEDYTKAEPMASASVSLSEAGTREHGTMMSEGGWFTDVALEHADWIVDPGLWTMTTRSGSTATMKNGDDEFHYDIYLRPWGSYWDDMEEQARPNLLCRLVSADDRRGQVHAGQHRSGCSGSKRKCGRCDRRDRAAMHPGTAS